MLALLKKNFFRIEYIFLAIAAVNLLSAFVFKTQAENKFIALDRLVMKAQVDYIGGSKTIDDLRGDFFAFTYFDKTLAAQLDAIMLLAESGIAPEGAPSALLFYDFTDGLHLAAKRLRFGYDSLIYSSLALILITVVILLINTIEQKKEIIAIKTRSEDQKQISRDIHDGVAQTLAALKIQLQKKNFKKAASFADIAVNELRWLCGLLRFDLTGGLDKLTAQNARVFEETYAIPVNVFYASEYMRQASDHVKMELLRIQQECLANIARHAQASAVSIKLIDAGSLFSMIVSDNGRGFDPAAIEEKAASHLGLKSIRERAHNLGGKAEWKITDGVTVAVTIPLQGALPQ